MGDTVLAASFRLVLGRCRGNSGQLSAGQADLDAALRVLTPLGPSQALAKGLAYLAGRTCAARNGPDGERFARQAIAVAASAGSDRFRLLAYNFLGWALALQGLQDEAIRWLDDSWTEAIALGIDTVASHSLLNAAVARTEAFRAAEVEKLALRFDDLVPSLFGAWAKPFALGFAALTLGRLKAAANYLTVARDAVGDADAHVHAKIGEAMAHVLAESGRSEEALRLLDGHDLSPSGREELSAWLTVCLSAGDPTQAERTIHEALERDPEVLSRNSYRYVIDCAVEALLIAKDLDEARAAIQSVDLTRPMDPWTSLAHGRLALVLGNLDEANDLLHSALARFEAAGYRIDEIRCRMVLAEVRAALGALDAVKAELDIAVAVAIGCEPVWREGQVRDLASRLGIVLNEPVRPHPREDARTGRDVGTVGHGALC